jgi:hypothetical protein
LGKVKGIKAAGAKSWTEAARWLETRFPERWGDNRNELKELRAGLTLLSNQLAKLKEMAEKVRLCERLPSPGAGQHGNGNTPG